MARIETKMPDGSIVVSGQDDPPVPFQISKNAIRDILDSFGMEEKLDELLASNTKARNRWNDAPYLLSDNEILLQMIPAAAQALGRTEAEVIQLLQAARTN